MPKRRWQYQRLADPLFPVPTVASTVVTDGAPDVVAHRVHVVQYQAYADGLFTQAAFDASRVEWPQPEVPVRRRVAQPDWFTWDPGVFDLSNFPWPQPEIQAKRRTPQPEWTTWDPTSFDAAQFDPAGFPWFQPEVAVRRRVALDWNTWEPTQFPVPPLDPAHYPWLQQDDPLRRKRAVEGGVSWDPFSQVVVVSSWDSAADVVIAAVQTVQYQSLADVFLPQPAAPFDPATEFPWAQNADPTRRIALRISDSFVWEPTTPAAAPFDPTQFPYLATNEFLRRKRHPVHDIGRTITGAGLINIMVDDWWNQPADPTRPKRRLLEPSSLWEPTQFAPAPPFDPATGGFPFPVFPDPKRRIRWAIQLGFWEPVVYPENQQAMSIYIPTFRPRRGR